MVVLLLAIATFGQTTEVDSLFVSAEGSDSHHPNKAVLQAENQLHALCKKDDGPKLVNAITSQALKNEQVVSVGYAEGHFYAVVTGNCVVYASPTEK